MNRDHRSDQYDRNRDHNRRPDEDQYRGAYRQDTDRRGEYDHLNRQNFNDRSADRDYRSNNYRGSNEDLRRERDHELSRDYGRDPNRRGERFDNMGAHEDNNGLEGATRNFGNMGSYGGAQGWGSSGNGSHRNEGGDRWASGHGREESRPVNRQVYGAYRDHNSFAEGEREQYDGTSRAGGRGADNTRGWEPADRAGSNGAVRRLGTNDISRRDDDSRYEIYDSAQAHYNRGEYSQQFGGGTYLGEGFDRRSRAEGGANMDYNHGRREHYNQQGEGMRSENYGNSAGSLSWGYDGDFRDRENRESRYDPMSGHVRTQGSRPPAGDDFTF
ncbi:hypothetical protein [Rufibacter psychrotolerans]|uniref:hypothetical protein n=1 Tax=Rufibacter psychrotolerans TaxID=2812556 RepID=UPI0019670277|nr:hypothetical protein [Rufibacter sp. SYSU D00308]